MPACYPPHGPRCQRCNRPLSPAALHLYNRVWPVFCGVVCQHAWAALNARTRRPRRRGRQVREREARAAAARAAQRRAS